MKLVRLLLTDLANWQRLRFTGAEWALLFGFTVGVVPAVSTALAMTFWYLFVSVLDGAFDLTGLPTLLAISGMIALLYGLIPGGLAFLALRLVAAGLGYINLQLTLLVAGSGALIANFIVLGLLHPLALGVSIAALAVTAIIWTLLRAAGLGTRHG